MLSIQPQDEFESSVLSQENTMSDEAKLALIATHRRVGAIIEGIKRTLKTAAGEHRDR